MSLCPENQFWALIQFWALKKCPSGHFFPTSPAVEEGVLAGQAKTKGSSPGALQTLTRRVSILSINNGVWIYWPCSATQLQKSYLSFTKIKLLVVTYRVCKVWFPPPTFLHTVPDVITIILAVAKISHLRAFAPALPSVWDTYMPLFTWWLLLILYIPAQISPLRSSDPSPPPPPDILYQASC